jgi:hypothetical protein
MDANRRTTLSIEKNHVEAAQLADLAELIKSYLAKTRSAAQ